MAQLPIETETYEDILPKFARDRAIREWEQNSGTLIYQEGNYRAVGRIDNQTSVFRAADNYFAPATASNTMPGMCLPEDKDFLTEDQISDESEWQHSLIEKLSHYLRKMNIEKGLRGYLRLEEGWDGVNSVSPRELAVDDAISFLHRFSDTLTQPTPMLAADGEIGLYWRYRRAYVELEFTGDGLMFGYARGINGKETFIDDVLLESGNEMEKTIATICEIVAEFPLDDD